MADKKIVDHKYVYGGYEVGSGGPIWCKICGEDVDEHAYKEEEVAKPPIQCAHCNQTFKDHYPLGNQMVCYNQDPNKMAIIQGTRFTAPK